MIRFIRDPQLPYTQFKQGMVRDLGPVLESLFISAGDATAQASKKPLFGAVDTSDVPLEDQGSIRRSDAVAVAGVSTYLWAVGKVSAYEKVAQAMLALSNPALLPLPTRVKPHQITGTTYWLDPDWLGTASGTFTAPYKLLSQVPALGAGAGLLIKAGSTLNISAGIIQPANTGTTNAPVVYGVYDPTTGYRISGVSGVATLDCGSTLNTAFYSPGNAGSNVCIEGFKFINKGPGTPQAFVQFSGSSVVNVQLLNLVGVGSPGQSFSLSDVGANCVIEGCDSQDSGSYGIAFSSSVTDAAMTIQYNTVKNAGLTQFTAGIIVTCAGVRSATVIAANVVDGVTKAAGIFLKSSGGSPKIYRNTVRGCVNGISVIGENVAARDFSGTLVQNNDARFNEQNIMMAQTLGNWVVEYNRCTDAGTNDGINPVVTVGQTNYGRNIEIVATNVTYPAGEGTVRFNYCVRARCFRNDGSEGVGIACDNYSRNVRVHSNYIADNEGIGFSAYLSTAPMFYGNILVNNWCVPVAQTVGFAFQGNIKAQIAFSRSPFGRVFNNTIICRGTVFQEYGYSDNIEDRSDGVEVFNNLIVGPTLAGVLRRTTAGQTTERNNVIVGTPVLVASAATSVAISNAMSTRAGASDDFDIDNPFFSPVKGGACDSLGDTVPAWAVGFSGKALSLGTSIGALHANV